MKKNSLENHLIEMIKMNLSKDLLKPRWKDKDHWLAGHCYVASEALYHLLRSQKVWFPVRGRDANGDTHWWLQNKAGDILDPTAEQYTDLLLHPPYKEGVRGGFLTRKPSKRAQELIRRINYAR